MFECPKATEIIAIAMSKTRGWYPYIREKKKVKNYIPTKGLNASNEKWLRKSALFSFFDREIRMYSPRLVSPNTAFEGWPANRRPQNLNPSRRTSSDSHRPKLSSISPRSITFSILSNTIWGKYFREKLARDRSTTLHVQRARLFFKMSPYAYLNL